MPAFGDTTTKPGYIWTARYAGATNTDHGHWVSTSETSSSGRDEKLFKYSTAALGLTSPETPTQADADALVASNPNLYAGYTVRLTTPLGHHYSFEVKDDAANPGTRITTIIRKTEAAGVIYLSQHATDNLGPAADPADFEPNTRINVATGGSAGGWTTNAATDPTQRMWVQDDATTRLLSGGSTYNDAPIVSRLIELEKGQFDRYQFDISANRTFTLAEIPPKSVGISVDISANDVAITFPVLPDDYEVILSVVNSGPVDGNGNSANDLTFIFGDGTAQKFQNNLDEIAVDGIGLIKSQGVSELKIQPGGATAKLISTSCSCMATAAAITPITPTATVDSSDAFNFGPVVHTGTTGGSGVYTDYTWVITLVDQSNATITVAGADPSIAPVSVVDTRGVVTGVTGTLGSFTIPSVAGQMVGTITVDLTVTDDAAATGSI